MIKSYTLEIIVVFIIAAFFANRLGQKKTQLKYRLKKQLFSKQNVHLYKVQKGDVISVIIRRLPGITQDDIPDNYRIIKRTQPDVENFNKLYVGQIIKLPGKSTNPDKDNNKEEAGSATSTAPTTPAGTQTYKIKKGII